MTNDASLKLLRYITKYSQSFPWCHIIYTLAVHLGLVYNRLQVRPRLVFILLPSIYLILNHTFT